MMQMQLACTKDECKMLFHSNATPHSHVQRAGNVFYVEEIVKDEIERLHS